jgi:methyltransferase (TIGR00027 family)
MRRLFHLVRFPVLGALLLTIADRLAPGVRGFTVGRTRYIDDALAAALKEGIDQVVVLGAGYDSRAYRIPGIEATRVFELDLPSTQAEKRERLDRSLGQTPGHVTFVPIDFESQRLAEVLPRAGFRDARGTFFVCEGVTEEVSPQAVDSILRFVASASKPESKIAFTYIVRGLLDGTRHFPGTRMYVAYTGFSTRHFALNPEDLPAYLRQCGLELVEDVAGGELAERYFEPSGRRLRANEFHRTALARTPRTTV